MAIERGFCGHFFDHQENQVCPYCELLEGGIEVINPKAEFKDLDEITDSFSVVYGEQGNSGTCDYLAIVADRQSALGWWYYNGGRFFDDKLAELGCFRTSDSDFLRIFDVLIGCFALSSPWTEKRDDFLVGHGSSVYTFVINGTHWSLPREVVDLDKARRKTIEQAVDDFLIRGRLSSFSYYCHPEYSDRNPPAAPSSILYIDDIEMCKHGHCYDKNTTGQCPFCSVILGGLVDVCDQGRNGPVVGWLVYTVGHERGRDYPLASGYNDIGLNGVNLGTR